MARIWFFVVALLVTAAVSTYVSNLHSSCMRCLCQAASGCNHTIFCRKGYCGPFYLGHIYWVDAGRPVLQYDDPERDTAWEDCANEYPCATKIVTGYMAKFGKDCNGDGTTNCDDFAMLHFNGGKVCNKSMEGTNFNNRYIKCRPVSGEDELILKSINSN